MLPHIAPKTVTPAGVGGSDRLTRIASIDVVRLVALVAIVVGHVYTRDELADRLIQSWRLPVFFLLSGYFWSVRRTLADEVRRRSRSLLIPYVVWMAIITALTLPVRVVADPEGVRPAIIGVLLGGDYIGRPYTTFWFLTALFTAAAIYRALTRTPVAVRLSVVAVGLAANVVAGPALTAVPWAVATAFGALVFLEAGRCVRLAQERFSPRTLGAATLVALALAALPLLTASDFVPVDMKVGQFPVLAVAVALAIGMALLLAATAAPPLPPRAASVAATLAKPSLVVIILHPLVLWAARPETTSVPLPLVTAAAFLIPLALGLVVVRTRLSPWLAGVDRVPATR